MQKRIKIGGTHTGVLQVPFPAHDIVSLKIGNKYYIKSDTTRLGKGQFYHAKGMIYIHLVEKTTRPLLLLTYKERDNFVAKTTTELNRLSPPRSALYVKNSVKNKMSWGCTPAKGQPVETQIMIPSKYGRIIFDGVTVTLDNVVIAIIEQGTIVPRMDVLDEKGSYLYDRVCSIFEADVVRYSDGTEFHIENGLIYKNNLQIGCYHSQGVKFNSNASRHDELIVYRMVQIDPTLPWVSVRKREIQRMVGAL